MRSRDSNENNYQATKLYRKSAKKSGYKLIETTKRQFKDAYFLTES